MLINCPGRKEIIRIMSIALLLCTVAYAGGCRHTLTPEDIAYAETRYDLGLSEAEDGNVQGAIHELGVALDRYPDFAEAHNAMGYLLHLSMGRHEQAEKSYLEALRIRPDFSEAQNNLGALYIDMQRYEEAEKYLRMALDNVLYATPFIAQGNLGWLLYLQGRYEEAVVQLRSAVLVQPLFCQGYRNLGRIFRETGQKEEARDSFAQFVKNCPEIAEAQFEWGRIALEEGRYNEARKAFERCLKISSQGRLKESCQSHLDIIADSGDEWSGG